MISLVCVGLGRGTKTYSSKGYTIARAGRQLILRSGHIDVVSRSFYWRYSDHRRVMSFRSPAAAEAEETKLLRKKLQKNEGYRRLPSNVRIKHQRRISNEEINRKARKRAQGTPARALKRQHAF